MGCELELRKGNVDLYYWCSGYVFDSFNETMYLPNCEWKTITENDIKACIEYLETQKKDYENGIKTYEKILEGLHDFESRADCVDTIDGFNDEIEQINYACCELTFCKEIAGFEQEKNPLQIYCSY